MSELAAVVLAAGKGTRMDSDLAKVLHPLRGRPLLHWVLDALAPLHAARTVVVVGHQAERVEEAVRERFPAVEFVRQPAMLGTGHAVMQAEPLLRDFAGDVIVTCGDTPLIQTHSLRATVDARCQHHASAAMQVCDLDEPGAYGRVLLSTEGPVEAVVKAIIEAKDATPEQLRVRRVNVGTYAFDAQTLWPYLGQLGQNNRAGEYYLTDVVGLMTCDGRRVVPVAVGEREMTGINTRAQLQDLERQLAGEAR